jgi:Cu(I)/Ag(I) efflux system membrane fusion protein
MFNKYILFVFCAAAMASCKDNSATTATTETAQNTQVEIQRPPVQSSLSEEQSKVLVATLSSYYKLKDALVTTSDTKTKEAAIGLHLISDSLYKSAANDVPKDTKANPLAASLDTIITQSKNISEINDPTCEKQRVAFELVSSAMYGLLKKAELKNAGVYHQYCPMAFNDKGAYWLSDVSDIKNPYFGKKMLECGEVTDSL